MRGEDTPRYHWNGLKRETPPHAWGRPEPVRQPFQGREKHPHMRGEDGGIRMYKSIMVETPPHAWGRQECAAEGAGKAGNTPTCVGKTDSSQTLRPLRQKHPHMRGEDPPQNSKLGWTAETPPHAWGRRYNERPRARLGRNTPTCVGKTKRIVRHDKVIWKHPHMRGEDSSRLQGKHCKAETPPHAWGRQRFSKQTGRKVRNTPTCVGKTRVRSICVSSARKHPHMRGEDFPKMWI